MPQGLEKILEVRDCGSVCLLFKVNSDHFDVTQRTDIAIVTILLCSVPPLQRNNCFADIIEFH